MLSSIYLVIVIIATVMQNVFKKQFNIKTNGKGGFAFCGVSAIFAALIFVFYMLSEKTAFVFSLKALFNCSSVTFVAALAIEVKIIEISTKIVNN